MLGGIFSSTVSIHAPARGATTKLVSVHRFMLVSIHAPARGATANSNGSVSSQGFQSTRPRGARPPGPFPWCHRCSFNPRAREGRDTMVFMRSRPAPSFQSTRPRGARQPNRRGILKHKGFQSTRPRGARPRRCGRWLRSMKFQSTRPRGARLHCHVIGQGRRRFQSTRPRGARLEDIDGSDCKWRFNPRAREGRDTVQPKARISLSVFQSTRPRGARLRKAIKPHVAISFNPRAREGRDRSPTRRDT